MQRILGFIRLMRPLNLVIIAFTMYAMRFLRSSLLLLAAVIAPEFWPRLGEVSLLGGRVASLLEHAPGMLPYWFTSVVLLLPQNLFFLGVAWKRYQPMPIDLAAMKHYLDHRAVGVFFGTGLWILMLWWVYFSSLRDLDGDLRSRSGYLMFLPSWLFFSTFMGMTLTGGPSILLPLFKKPARDHA